MHVNVVVAVVNGTLRGVAEGVVGAGDSGEAGGGTGVVAVPVRVVL